MYSMIQVFYLTAVFCIILVHFFYKILPIDEGTFLFRYFSETGFWQKLLMIIFINHIISFFIPFEGKDKKLCYNFEGFRLRISSFILLWTLSYWFVIKYFLELDFSVFQQRSILILLFVMVASRMNHLDQKHNVYIVFLCFLLWLAIAHIYNLSLLVDFVLYKYI